MNQLKLITILTISSILLAACNNKPNTDNVTHKQNFVWTFFENSINDEKTLGKIVEKDVPEFTPDVRFLCTDSEFVAVKNDIKEILVTGMPIWNMYVTDLNGDTYPEFCATVSIGSGIIDERVIIVDYKNRKTYEVSNRMEYDYHLSKHEDKLIIRKSKFPTNKEESITGILSITDGELVIEYSNGETVIKSADTLSDLKGLTNNYSLARAKSDGCLVMEDGDVTSGKEVFDDFFDKTSQQKNAKIRVVDYYTLDKSKVSEEFYEQEKDGYPIMYITDVVYENGEFTTYSDANNDGALVKKTYKYLIKDEFEGNPEATFMTATYYMLVNDKSLTFNEIFQSLISSSYQGNGKDLSHFNIYQKSHFNIYQKYVYK